eukprot:GEMP01030912.1.p1 GENE.GEMP01030912.1~~GEMP01030912.1.p1  ORF type:complete len:329 (+),score=80.23 GEMP01030912.1:62-1048(+)
MLLVTWLVPQVAYGWNDHAMMLVAQIAQDQLADDGWSFNGQYLFRRGEYDLHAPPEYPVDTDDLLGEAVWFDKLKESHLVQYARQRQYINTPFEVNGTQCLPEKDGEYDNEGFLASLTSALQFIQASLEGKPAWIRGSTAYQYSAGYFLRVVVNLLGKLHQPLRNINACSPRFPRGDHAGREWTIHSNISEERIHGGNNVYVSNLQRLWDLSGGLYVDATWPLSVGRRIGLEAEAAHLRQEYPESSFENVTFHNHTSFYKWHEEAVAFAEQIYDAHGAPYDGTITDDYVRFVQRTAKRQISLASYRLASLLKTLSFFVSEAPNVGNAI